MLEKGMTKEAIATITGQPLDEIASVILKK